jgi:uncharacterized protein (TIGR00369 family)
MTSVRTVPSSGGDRHAIDLHGLVPPSGLMKRFGVHAIDVDTDAGSATVSMSLAGMLNPFTGAPSVAALALLVDVAAVVNHIRRRDDEWTVSSELSLEVTPDAVDHASRTGAPVVAEARSLGARAGSALSTCILTCDGADVGVGTVRAFYVGADAVRLDDRDDLLTRTGATTLADLMAVEVRHRSTGQSELVQHVDPTVNNALGIVHGGVAAAALELVSSATLFQDGAPMRTGSLRVNFLRPLTAGDGARYEGTAVRIGRGSGLADARAVNADGTIAMMARMAAYR